MRALELLAPAKNLACGIAAIDHGADAVYIGAPRFGARAQAGNSVADIASLCRYAHQYEARVYVTVNTLLYDEELSDACDLIQQLSEAHVDAVLLQDLRLLPMAKALPLASQLQFHASTQTDNRTADKVASLTAMGFSRVVLARELSIDEIADIHQAVPAAELEVFVHGALCVSYSGLCFASEHCFGRSANRGECAQFCRMKFDLVDADGCEVVHQRYLLSLKDLNMSSYLEALASAGATSFKIEGRLKDVAYVKNVTAAYSQLLDRLITTHPDQYCRASKGRVSYTFQPNLKKTFNRGYTTYFAHGRQPGIASFDTPKAIGDFVGTVKDIQPQSLVVAGTATFANGDGLCFFNSRHELEGFRVNRAVGNRLFPLKMPSGLLPGIRVFRNNDVEFERLLSRPSAERKIAVSMSLRATPDGFSLSVDGTTVAVTLPHEEASKPQRDNIIRQLTRLGNTPFVCDSVDIPSDFNYFIPSSQLAELRRMAVSSLECRVDNVDDNVECRVESVEFATAPQDYRMKDTAAVANSPLSTLHSPLKCAPLMQCRHCLRYALGHCVRHGGSAASWHEPLSLRLSDGRLFPLAFDCANCQMNVYAPKVR